jgi:uncharacterized protein YecE (DUF72 family)
MMAKEQRTLLTLPDGIRIGTSGWSYPSWRPGFYPSGLAPAEFLRFYAERFPTVELNTTGYRVPSPEQFRSWAEQAPDGFEFAPKLGGSRRLDAFVAGVRALGDRLGPVRVSLKTPRDDGAIELVLGSLDTSFRIAFDLEHPSWDGIEERLADAGAVRVNDFEHPAPFRYVRMREPPYDDAALTALANRLRAAAEPAYVYFRHEDEPSATAYAQRLAELLG